MSALRASDCPSGFPSKISENPFCTEEKVSALFPSIASNKIEAEALHIAQEALSKEAFSIVPSLTDK